jgi:hypothetical protein
MMDAQRLRLLEAMGIDVYALRAHDAVPVRAAVSTTNASGEAQAQTRLAIVCASGVRRDARLARLFAQLPQTVGVAAGAIEWLEADANGELAGAGDVPAYLVLGAAMARALGVQLSTMQQSTVTIAVTADPAQLPGAAADKRALWQTLKPIVRRLRGVAS